MSLNPLTGDVSTLTETSISIDGKDVNFSNLNLEERMHDLGHFSFTLIEGMTASGGMVPTNYYSKKVILGFAKADSSGMEYHSFTGLVTRQSSYHRDSNGTGQFTNNYNLSGSGVFVKLNGKKGCNSYLQKTLGDVLTDINKTQATIDTDGIFSQEWPYLVQYNQTAFEFMKMLAARFGQWMYYNGAKMIFGGKPSGESLDLKIEVDVQNFSIHGHIADASDTATGLDPKKGDPTKGSTDAPAPGGSDTLKATGDAGSDVYETAGTGAHYPSALTQDMLDLMHKLDQQAAVAKSVSVSGNSQDARLSVGRCINISDDSGTSSSYIITEIHHSANNSHGYSNYFSAVPAEVEVPPYTNPWLAPRMGRQHAKVVENEDKEFNQDYIKVRFAWMKDTETTPWIDVPSMYAGGEKGGAVWTPEKDEIVIIDFIDNNGEWPHYAGSITTEKNKSQVAPDGNSIKSIGTASGRRLEINDNDGSLRLYDNFTQSTPKNGILFKRKDDDIRMLIESQKDDNNYSIVMLNNQDALNLGVVENGELIVEIKLEKTDKKITIHSKGSIELNADESISLNAANINIKASQKLSMEGTQDSVEIKGMKIAATADTSLDLKGANSTLKGDAQVEVSGAMANLKGTGVTTVKGMPVMIN